MFDTTPDATKYLDAPWEKYAPFYAALQAQDVTEENLYAWLDGWTWTISLISEVYARLALANTQDTTDEAAEKRYHVFLQEVQPKASAADQGLKTKLLDTGLTPEGYEIPLRALRSDADLFREANLPLISKEETVGSEYDKIFGLQAIEWDGEERTLAQMQPILNKSDRPTREKIQRAIWTRQLQDRGRINEIWGELMKIRLDITKNAGMDNYRAYKWRQMQRFDYTSKNCFTFHDAIEKVVVPAARRRYEKKRARLGVDTLRPWDVTAPEGDLPPLAPFTDVSELDHTASVMFNKVDPAIGEYYATMQRENLLDIDNRKGKAPGAYCTDFAVLSRPFIFGNAVGTHDDVQMLLHEAGHAFHVFEAAGLKYAHQLNSPMEFNEVASMAMELLAAPYLAKEQGGFYTTADAARARVEHLDSILFFWPYMAVVDAFQHWVYDNPAEAVVPTNCDAMWSELWDRFMVGQDWSGLQAEKETGWHRKLHIHRVPFYYIEYGLAQLGAVQVWANALENQAGAVAAYRQALSLGGTVTLPQLYESAGAKLAFDAETLGGAVDLIESFIRTLEKHEAA